MNSGYWYLFRVPRFFIAVLSVTLASVLILPVVSRAWTPTTPQISVAIFGGAGNDYGYSVAVDASGNVYTTGTFEGTVDFDPGSGTTNLTAAGIADVFVSKLNSSGEFLWAKKFGSAGVDTGNTVAVDASGNVYTTGTFEGTVDFDPGSITHNLISAGGLDVFVSKLNASGGYVWAKKFGGTGYDIGNSIAVDASGNVYTTGYFVGAAAFDPSTSANNLSSAGSSDVFVTKLDASGEYMWAKKFGGTGYDSGQSVTVDASGNVYTTGYFVGAAAFDPSTSANNLTSVGGSDDVFVSKLDASGGFVWAKKFGGAGFDYATSVAVDSSGNVYTTGTFVGAAAFDPSTSANNLTSAGSGDVFVSKLSPTGGFVWAKKFGGIGYDDGNSVAMDTSGNVYTTGSFQDTADFGLGSGASTLISSGSNDVFVSKLSPTGGFVWAKKFGGQGDDSGTLVAVDSPGNVYTTGYFEGTANFDPSTSANNVTSTGSSDVFVVRLNPLGDSLASAAATTTTTVPVTTTTTTTTVPVTTTTTTVPATTTTTTTVPATTTTTTTTTVPEIKIFVVTTKKSVTAKAIAAYAQLAVKPESVVSLKAAMASSTFCKVFGATLKGLKPGSCKVTVTVKPAKGKSASKTITLKISK